MHGLWNLFFFDELVHGFDGLFGEAAQIPGKRHLSAALALGVEDGPSGNVQPEQLFEAQGLSAQLGVVVVELAAFTLFELDWNQRTVGMALDDIALAAEPEPFRPDGQGAQQGHVLDGFVAGNIGLLMDDSAERGVLVGPAPPFNRLQSRPSMAEEVVVEEREGDGIGRIHNIDTSLFLNASSSKIPSTFNIVVGIGLHYVPLCASVDERKYSRHES